MTSTVSPRNTSDPLFSQWWPSFVLALMPLLVLVLIRLVEGGLKVASLSPGDIALGMIAVAVSLLVTTSDRKRTSVWGVTTAIAFTVIFTTFATVSALDTERTQGHLFTSSEMSRDHIDKVRLAIDRDATKDVLKENSNELKTVSRELADAINDVDRMQRWNPLVIWTLITAVGFVLFSAFLIRAQRRSGN
jgi:hypothetical protein